MSTADAAVVQPALSLRANFSWTLLGNVVYAGCQWAMLMALAKLTSPAEVGRFALGLAVTAPLFMFLNLQLRAVQATDAARTVPFSDYLGLRLRTTALALAVACAVACSGRFERETALLIVALGVAKAVESICDVVYGRWQQHEQMDRIARSLLLRGVLGLLLLASGIALGHRAVWGAVGLTAGWAAVLVGRDLAGVREALRRPRARAAAERRRDLARLALLGLPLGAVMLLISLNANIPRYFLESARGPADLGIFAALASVLAAVGVVVNALGQSATPRLARLAAEKDRGGFLRLLAILLGLGAALGLCGVAATIAVGRPVVVALFTPVYGAHQTELVTIVVSAAIGAEASFLGYAMTALRAFRPQVPLFVTACALTGGWAALDVPRAGLQGAARALVASAVVQLAGSAWVVIRALPPKETR